MINRKEMVKAIVTLFGTNHYYSAHGILNFEQFRYFMQSTPITTTNETIIADCIVIIKSFFNKSLNSVNDSIENKLLQLITENISYHRNVNWNNCNRQPESEEQEIDFLCLKLGSITNYHLVENIVKGDKKAIPGFLQLISNLPKSYDPFILRVSQLHLINTKK